MHNVKQIKVIIFDWGNTLMVDLPNCRGPMLYWQHIELMPNVIMALNFLYKKIPLCVASNAGDSNTELMKMALDRGGIKNFFNFYYSSDDAGYCKPDKRFFLSLADYLKVLPEQCLMIGNDYYKDIVGAYNVGMKTMFYNYLRNEGNYDEATEVFYDFLELPLSKCINSIIKNYI